MSTLDLKSVTLSNLPVQYCYCKTGLCLLFPPPPEKIWVTTFHAVCILTLLQPWRWKQHISPQCWYPPIKLPQYQLFILSLNSDFQSRNKLCNHRAFSPTSTHFPYTVWKSVHYQFLKFKFQAFTWSRSFTLWRKIARINLLISRRYHLVAACTMYWLDISLILPSATKIHSHVFSIAMWQWGHSELM
jgi:hypothetical protein